MSVRNTFNGLLWIGALALYMGLSGLLHAALGRSRLELAAALLAPPTDGGLLRLERPQAQRETTHSARRPPLRRHRGG